MDRSKILKVLSSKKAKDYTYSIAFFLVFSFFVLAVIRPNIISVFTSNAKIEQLEKDNSALSKQIDYVIQTQQNVEKVRDDLYLLKEAIANFPQVSKVLSDLNLSLEQNNISVDKINIGEINLKDKGKNQKLKTVTLQIFGSGMYDDFKKFIDTLYNQRRLKLIKGITISKDDKAGSESAKLQMKFEVEGYYL